MGKNPAKSWSLADTAVKVAVICCVIPLAWLFWQGLGNTAYLVSTWSVEMEMQHRSVAAGLLLVLLGTGLLGGLASWLVRRSADPERLVRRLCLGVCVWVLAAGAFWLFQLEYPPYPGSDMHYIWATAKAMAEGHVDVLQQQYFWDYPFQVGLVLFFELLFRLLGTSSHWVAGWLNLASVVVCTWCGYRLTRRISARPEAACLYLALAALCLPPILLVPLFYGDLPSFACSWLALFFTTELLATRRCRYLVGVVPALFLGTLLRRTTMIVAAAILIVLLTQFFLRKKDRWTAKQYLAVGAAILLVLCSSFQMNRILNRYLQFRTGRSLSQGFPSTNWLVMGNRETDLHCGWFSGWNIYLLETYGLDYDGMDDKCRAELGRRIEAFRSDPGYAAWFYKTKLSSGWLDPSYQSLHCKEVYDMTQETGVIGTPLAKSAYDGALYPGLMAFMDQYQNLVLCGAVLGTLGLWKKRGSEIGAVLPPVVFLGGFLFYLFWEIKSRYCLSFYMILLPVAAAGLWQLAQWLGRALAALRSRARGRSPAGTAV